MTPILAQQLDPRNTDSYAHLAFHLDAFEE